VATRRGCRWGDFFEGCETGGGKRRHFVSNDSLADRTDRMPAGNAVNPRIGSGMQQARNSGGGESRRGGAKPRGRNGIRGWSPRTEVGPAMARREWTPAEHVDGGAGSQRCDRANREPRDRSGNRQVRRTHLETRTAASGSVFHRARAVQGDTRRFESRSTERVPQTGFDRLSAEPASSLEGPHGDVQGQGGRSEGQPSCTAASTGTPVPSKR